MTTSLSRKKSPAPRSDFVGLHTVNEGKFFVPFSVDEVFPLYGPVEEANWVTGWEPRWIYPERAVAETSKPAPGWVFTTGKEAAETRVWYLAKVNPAAHEISYLVHWPGQMVYRIEVSAEPAVDSGSAKQGTSTAVRYEFVGTSEQGNRQLMEVPTNWATERLGHWRRSIQDYLERQGRKNRRSVETKRAPSQSEHL